MTLKEAAEGKEYTVGKINADDEELTSFLFSLGCYSGEKITVVSRRKHSCIVSIKDGRYNIDNELAEAICVLTDEAPEAQREALSVQQKFSADTAKLAQAGASA